MRYWILVVLLATAGCSSQSNVENEGVKDRARIAAEYVAATDLRSAADAVFPLGYTLEEVPRQTVSCHAGGVLYHVSFIAHGIDPNQIDKYFDLMLEFWSFSGWNLQNDSRSSEKEVPSAMFMNATKDDYLMGIRAGESGQVAISNNTPCI